MSSLTFDDIVKEAVSVRKNTALPVAEVMEALINFCWSTDPKLWRQLFLNNPEAVPIQEKFFVAYKSASGGTGGGAPLNGKDVIDRVGQNTELWAIVCCTLVKLLDACTMYPGGLPTKSGREKILGKVIVDSYYEVKRSNKGGIWDFKICLHNLYCDKFINAITLEQAKEMSTMMDAISDAEDYAEDLAFNRNIDVDDLPPEKLLEVYTGQESALLAELGEKRAAYEEVEKKLKEVREASKKQKAKAATKRDMDALQAAVRTKFGDNVFQAPDNLLGLAKKFKSTLAACKEKNVDPIMLFGTGISVGESNAASSSIVGESDQIGTEVHGLSDQSIDPISNVPLVYDDEVPTDQQTAMDRHEDLIRLDTEMQSEGNTSEMDDDLNEEDLREDASIINK